MSFYQWYILVVGGGICYGSALAIHRLAKVVRSEDSRVPGQLLTLVIAAVCMALMAVQAAKALFMFGNVSYLDYWEYTAYMDAREKFLWIALPTSAVLFNVNTNLKMLVRRPSRSEICERLTPQEGA